MTLRVEPLGNPLNTGRLRLCHSALIALRIEPLGNPLDPGSLRCAIRLYLRYGLNRSVVRSTQVAGAKGHSALIALRVEPLGSPLDPGSLR